MVRGAEERLLLDIPATTIKSWKNDSVIIGNQPGGYKLRFKSPSSIFDRKGLMLDDISFEYCGEGDVPAGSDQLSCDFERDTCSWYHDYTASLLWDRTERKFQDDSKKNYCMLIEATNKHNISSTAKLVSFPQPAGRVLCVSFWYHIFGNSIGSLKFITKHPGEPETVVWMRSGTQGNKWRFADLTFNSDKPIQFIIEAVQGGNQGSIAIDDIVVYSSADGSCPPERECTFQASLCGLQSQPSANLTWGPMRGASVPTNSSGPTADHTLGTDQGYYLSAQLWRHPVGSRSVIMTAVMEPTPLDGECLMFWYYMEGSGVGELTVHLQTLDSNKNPRKLWHRSGDQGKHWRHGRVTLLSPDSSYQVIFEATAGDAPKRDIAIDDLTFLNGACPPEGFCDFEMDLCGWVNSPPAQLGLEWDWLSGHSQHSSVLIPKRDHTTDSSLGHFVFFHGSKKNELARLESETMGAVDRACLELWHYSQGWSSGGPSAITLTVFVQEAAGLRAVWNTRGYMNNTWIQDRVDYNASESHQIVLQAVSSTLAGGSFALDDVHIIRNRSCDYIVPTTTAAPATSTTPAPASAMDCSFEQGLCNWIQEDSDDLNWSLSSGLQVDQPWHGPHYDHTVGNNQGFFMLLNGSRSENGGRAVISVPVVDVKSHVCVGFWYYMLGPSISTLDLLVQTDSSEVLVWTRRGTQNPEWMNAEVTIDRNDVIQMMFSGQRKTKDHGFIAIDDIRVREGACSDQNVCTFQSSQCGYENSVIDKDHWVRERGTEHHVDHTYGTENGFYMSATITNSTESEDAQLQTPELSSDTEMCLRFWYWLPAGSSNSLVVHVLHNGEQGDALWQQPAAPSTSWEVAEVTVSSPGKFHVGFTTVLEPGSDSTVKLDDISVMDGACEPPGSCDFESGECSWSNVPNENGHDWFLANGGFHGPPRDHTTQTPEGGFLLSSPLHLNHISLAQVVSEWIQPKAAPYCLSLWYYMESSGSGTLRVYLRSGPSEQDQLFHRNSSRNSWTRFFTSVEKTKPFQLLIEAEATNMGFIAVDDISVTPGLCQANETSSGFNGCSFENDTCGWKDTSVGQLEWVRGRNKTGNTGPSVDNTLGTELGWYMAVGSDRGDQMSPAALQSPTMKQASSTCTLHFFYNLYGEDIKELNAELKVGSRSSALWWISGSHGNLWHHGEVTVGRVPQEFTILFTASRTFNNPGHLAIDDIDFRNCTLPEPQPLCPENMFLCNNSVCVDYSQVCDFSDDCGDRSDEINCEQHGVVERCSFNRGLCSWTQSDVDTPGNEWKVGKGENMWPSHGPPRDHTHNSAAGFYIIPTTQLTSKGQTSEILSRTLLPSLNCSVRFFYFGLGDDVTARLTVQSRTLRSGSGDRQLWFSENPQGFSWRRAEVRFSSSGNSKVVFRYEHGSSLGGSVALDDISFSKECAFDPDNNKLPDTLPTSPPPPSTTSTTQVKPCQDNEFFCWASTGQECIQATLQCDYYPDCPQGEDEGGCGPCSFESDQCQWTDASEGQSKWQRERASDTTEPPCDHTTHTGYFMRVNVSRVSEQSEARLQSPLLPPSSSYCQILFHFHISAENTGSLRVLMQQAEGSEAILWSRSHNAVSNWTAETLLLGLNQQSYKVLLSGTNKASHGAIAVDDISFLNCEKSYQPPALPAYGCSFEDGLCVWMQGAEDDLDWLSMSGPTDTNNTGPAGDHTTGKGKYLYIKSSPPSGKGHVAQLKSLPLPPAGEKGYCLSFWYHMFGATVGSLRMFLQTADPSKKTLVWQKSRNQGDEWLLLQSHVTLQEVHQVVVEATVGGEAGDIAIDDISFITGPCPASDLCDFEDGTCNWQQQTSDDYDWIRESGPTNNPYTGPDTDHTTNTATGHYYYLPSSAADQAGQTAAMSSPLFPTDKGVCVQLWYHMYGEGMGTLNVYQQSEDGKAALIFSQTGDHGKMWRFAQASLLPRVQPYRIVVEGVKAGPTLEGDMAFDDVHLTQAHCPPPGFCDFEINMCGWSNLGGGVDQGDWLRGTGASANPNTGPGTDHTTNSTQGYYLYVDSTVGEWGAMYFLVSEVFQPSTRGHCLTFWYHMYGSHVGTLRVYINDREMHTGGNEEGMLIWIETGNKGDEWKMASVSFKHETSFWLVFVYQRGMNPGGDVALDDITVVTGSCYSDPPPEDHNDTTSIVLAVTLTLLAGFILAVFLFILNRKCSSKNPSGFINSDGLEQDCEINVTQRGSDLSFDNVLYDLSPHASDADVASTDA